MVCIGLAIATRILRGSIDNEALSIVASVSLFFGVVFDGLILAAIFS